MTPTPEVLAYIERTGHRRYLDLIDPGHPDHDPAYLPILEARARNEPPTPPDPPLPSLSRQALNYARAEARDVAAGRPRLDAEAVAARLAVCRGDAEAGIPACPEYRASDDRCSACGCWLQNKAVRELETCPRGKWPA